MTLMYTHLKRLYKPTQFPANTRMLGKNSLSHVPHLVLGVSSGKS